MNRKRWILAFAVLLTSLFVILPSVQALVNPALLNEFDISYELNPEANFFGQVENTTPVEIPTDYESELEDGDFEFVSETNRLKLYVKEDNFNIAVVDIDSGYIWYSVYPDYTTMGYSGTSKYFIESGVVIEYYNLDNILIEDSKSYLSGSRYHVDIDYNYDTLTNGVVAHLTFEDLAIEFDVEVSIEADKLVVHLPMDSLVEGDIEKEMLNIDGTTTLKITSYRLKSVYLFPYFGANNYEINGYAMVPDGSGALIRYTDRISATAYTKRIYGADDGIAQLKTINWTNAHLQDELTASLPIFGINHGYQQAAFLAVLQEGDANAEIHSYPYGYNSYQINTTFMKFIVRERYTIQTSSSSSESFQLINTEPYPADYRLEYYFLAGEEASYSGMATRYQKILSLDQRSAIQSAAYLKIIAQDFKNGLFGKNFVEMTTYDQVVEILQELKEAGLDSLELEYFAWNAQGYFQNASQKPLTAANLGGKNAFLAMDEYLDENGVRVFYTRNPAIAFEASLGQDVIKKITLTSFATTAVKSSVFTLSYFRDPEGIAERILEYASNYEKLDMDSFVIDSLGQKLFSYRYGGTSYTRNQMKLTLVAEIEALHDYAIAMSRPNGYLYSSLASYYQMPVESNKYSYMTDSIPFIPMMLHGHVSMYSDFVNYVSDYGLFAMRLIEYGVMPSFIVTAEATHLLRYTNLEYLFTTEFDLWSPTILEMTHKVENALANVATSAMIQHRYVLPGVAETTYANGTRIFVNYTSSVQVVEVGIAVAPYGTKVVTLE